MAKWVVEKSNKQRIITVDNRLKVAEVKGIFDGAIFCKNRIKTVIYLIFFIVQTVSKLERQCDGVARDQRIEERYILHKLAGEKFIRLDCTMYVLCEHTRVQ